MRRYRCIAWVNSMSCRLFDITANIACLSVFVCVCEKTGVNKRNILNKMSNFVKMEIFANYQKYIDNEQELREVSIII